MTTNDLVATAAMIKLSEKKRTSHVLHLLLSIITMGLWLPVWVLVHASNVSENQKLDNEVRRMTGMHVKRNRIGNLARAVFMLVLLGITGLFAFNMFSVLTVFA